MTENPKKPRRTPKIDAAREILWAAGSHGLTWLDYAAATGAHHGSASGMLSRLHKTGIALRLKDKRDGNSVYVAPEFREERDIVPPRAPRAIGPAAIAPTEEPNLEAIRRDAYAEGVAAGRAHERGMAERRAEEHDEHIRLAGFAEGIAQAQAELLAAREEAFADGRNLGIEEGRIEGSSQSTDTAYHDGYRAGQEQAEAQWQEGYDEGIRVGSEAATAEIKRRMVDAGGEPYLKGREIGRREGEDLVRRHAIRVAAELTRAIRDGSPIRAHFSGCYRVHPECAVKSLIQGIGVTPDKLRAEINVA